MHCYKILARAPAREPDTHANVKINLMHPNSDYIMFFLMFLERAGQNNQWLFFFEVGLRSSAGDF